jgi:hypothetical protein
MSGRLERRSRASEKAVRWVIYVHTRISQNIRGLRMERYLRPP